MVDSEKEHIGILTSVTITNRADAANTLVRARLLISYAWDGAIHVLALPSLTKSPVALPPPREDVFVSPARIEGHDAFTGWCMFEVSEALVGGRLIDSYELQFDDAHGVSVTCPLGYLRDVAHET